MTAKPKYKVFPLGENALTIDFGNRISANLNDIVTSLATRLEKKPFWGFIECVPAYSSLTVFYDLFETKRRFRTSLSAFEIARSFVEMELFKLEEILHKGARSIEIPLTFGKSDAPDLELVAETNRLGPDEVIEIFLTTEYRVFMLGFLPGFAYMGALDERIATPRKQNPRRWVAQGSVGIAGMQTGIYPLESPGGWQIIGRTNVKLFDAWSESPTLFQAGDTVKFVRA